MMNIQEATRQGLNRGSAPGVNPFICIDEDLEEILVRDAEAAILHIAARSLQDQVYFALDLDSGQIKVGFTTNLESRIRALRSATRARFAWFRSVPGDRSVENQAHCALALYRNCGEWFTACPRALDIVGRLLAAASTETVQ